MRKKYLSALLFGALLVASAGTFTSCKDYDDEINGLQEQVDKIASDVKALQDAAGKYVTAVSYDATTGKLTVTGGNGETFQLPMPAKLPTYSLEVKDGKIYLKENGKVVSEAELPAMPEIPEIPEIPEAFNPELLKWGADGYLYYGEVKIEGVQKPVFDASITEIKDNGEVLGYIIAVGDDTATFYVKSDLKSLVFKPEFYLDGIEAMESKYIPYKALTDKKGTSTAVYKSVTYTISEPNDYRQAKENTVTYVNPDSYAEYQMNPSSARVEDFKDALSILSDDKQFINFSTSRTAQADPTKATFVEAVNGDMKVSFKVKGQYIAAQAEPLSTWADLMLPADADYANDKDYVTHMALQANLKTASKDTIITSDYSALYASQIRPENIAYPKSSYAEDSFYEGYSPISDHNEPSTTPGQGYHLYTHVVDAVKNEPTVKVAWDGDIDLSKLVCLHYLSNSQTKFGNDGLPKVMTAEELGKYNLKFKFDLVEYKGGTNATSESDNCELKANTAQGLYNGEMTILDPCGVNASTGKPHGQDGKETVGRMPLVRVSLIDTENNKIIEAGYIKLIIVESTSALEVDFNKGDQYFKCNPDPVKLTWSETQEDLLGVIGEHGMSKEEFDNLYVIDTDATGEIRQFNRIAEGKYEEILTSGSELVSLPFKVGTVREVVDPTAPTTTCLEWTLTDDDYRNLRRYATVDHVNKTIQYQYSIYVRYKGRVSGTTGIAPKAPIFVEVKVTLNYPYATLDNKNANYWYAKEAKTQGFEAVHFNVEVPGTASSACRFEKDINAVFTMNTTKGQLNEIISRPTATITEPSPSFGVDSKFVDFQDNKLAYVYYFTAENNGKVVYGHANGIDGTNPERYTLSVNYSTVRTDKYNYEAGDYDYYQPAGEEYNNDKLYATNGGVTELVATIDQTTGIVKYNELSTFAKDILNHEHHKNLKVGETFRAEVGVAAFNDCAQLFPIADNEFDALFLRPVNIEKNDPKEFHDAGDGGTAYTEQYILDIVKLSDWRDFMFANNLSYFNYYQISDISVDENNIYTNMNQSNGAFVPLRNVTNKIKFDYVPQAGRPALPGAGYTMAQLKDYYGKLVYINNEANVHAFDIKVPIKVTYKWGEYTIWVEIPVNKTINQ